MHARRLGPQSRNIAGKARMYKKSGKKWLHSPGDLVVLTFFAFLGVVVVMVSVEDTASALRFMSARWMFV